MFFSARAVATDVPVLLLNQPINFGKGTNCRTNLGAAGKGPKGTQEEEEEGIF